MRTELGTKGKSGIKGNIALETGSVTWLSVHNEAIVGMGDDVLWAMKLDLSSVHDGWSWDGLDICFELVGKYLSLYNSICSGFLN